MTLLLLPLALAVGRLVWTRLPDGDGSEDLFESLFATILAGFLVIGCAALLLAEFGVLRPLSLVIVLAGTCGVLLPLPRRYGRAVAPTLHDILGAALVTGLATTVVLPASEDLLGGRDSGTYSNTAAWVAREGTLQVCSQALADMPDEWLRIFHASALFPGFYIIDAATGQLAPQFLHLQPVLMAIGYWLSGLTGLFVVPSIFGVLAILAVFLFVRRTLGVITGVIAALLLALNLAQIWNARNPYSEIPTQLSVFSALWCLAVAQQTGGLRWGLLGGAALGISFLLRVDAPLLLATIAPALLVLSVRSPRAPRWVTHGFLPVSVLFAVWGAIHGLLFSLPYVRDLADMLMPLWAVTALTVALSTLALFGRARLSGLIQALHRHGGRLWVFGAIVLVNAFVFLMAVRPYVEPFVISPRTGMRTYAEEALVRVGWYFSLPGMVLALAGVVLLLRRWLVERRSEWLPFLLLFLAFALLYLWNPRIHPDHPWMMRRFLPVVVPGISIAIAAAISALWSARGRWRLPARIAAGAGLAIVLAHEIAMTAPFLTMREKDGLVAQLAAISRQIPEGSLLLFDRPGPEAGVATPLAMVWERPVLPVIRLPDDPGGERRRGRFEAQVLRWLREGRDILYLTAGDGDAVFLTREVRWEETANARIDVPTFGVRYDGPPREPQRYTADFRLLRAVPAADDPLPCAGSTLHAGGRLGNVMQGLYGLETTRRERFHWAAPRARVMFPACRRTDADRPARLRVRASCGREPSGDDCLVRVAVNGEPAGVLELSGDFADHEVPLPPEAVSGGLGAIEVAFSGPEFVPRAPEVRQPRVLSFQIQGVTLEGPR